MPGRAQPHATQHSTTDTWVGDPEEGKRKEHAEIKTSPTTFVTLASCSTSLCLSFVICQTEILISTIGSGGELNEILYVCVCLYVYKALSM